MWSPFHIFRMCVQAWTKKTVSKDDWEKKLAAVKIYKEDMNKLVMNFLVTEASQLQQRMCTQISVIYNQHAMASSWQSAVRAPRSLSEQCVTYCRAMLMLPRFSTKSQTQSLVWTLQPSLTGWKSEKQSRVVISNKPSKESTTSILR